MKTLPCSPELGEDVSEFVARCIAGLVDEATGWTDLLLFRCICVPNTAQWATFGADLQAGLRSHEDFMGCTVIVSRHDLIPEHVLCMIFFF